MVNQTGKSSANYLRNIASTARIARNASASSLAPSTSVAASSPKAAAAAAGADGLHTKDSHVSLGMPPSTQVGALVGHTHTCIHIRACTHINTYTCIHICAHKCTNTHMHMHTHRDRGGLGAMAVYLLGACSAQAQAQGTCTAPT